MKKFQDWSVRAKIVFLAGFCIMLTMLVAAVSAWSTSILTGYLNTISDEHNKSMSLIAQSAPAQASDNTSGAVGEIAKVVKQNEAACSQLLAQAQEMQGVTQELGMTMGRFAL